jgi:WD40 repeat protein
MFMTKLAWLLIIIFLSVSHVFSIENRLAAHSGDITAISFSKDRKKLLSGSVDTTVRLWDIERGKEIRIFEGHTNIILCLDLSPDGKRAISGSDDKTVRLWDIETGKEVSKFEGFSNKIIQVTFSPDNKHSIIVEPNTIHYMDLESLKEVKQFSSDLIKSNLKEQTSYITSAAFSPDGKKILIGSSFGTVILLEISTCKELRRFEQASEGGTGVLFTPNGHYILASSRKLIRVYNQAMGQDMPKESGDLHIWDVSNERELHSLKGCFNILAFSPNGHLLISLLKKPPFFGGREPLYQELDFGEFILWDWGNGNQIHSFGKERGIVNATFSEDGNYIIIAGTFGSVSKINLKDYNNIPLFNICPKCIEILKVNPSPSDS